MANEKTVFQKLTDVLIGSNNAPMTNKIVSSYSLNAPDEVLYTFGSQEERDTKLQQLKQQRLLQYQWHKIGYDTSMEQLQGATQVRMMYRDCDMMDMWPEIGAALDTYAEEACTQNKLSKILNISSSSERIVSILEDLFINRLDVHILLPMIIRSLCKYGNEFMYLNIDGENGIVGWRELPVTEIRRIENGMINAYSGNFSASTTRLKPDEVKFIWEGHNENVPFQMWQIAHFRLIKDSIYLPYGCSILNKARRAWRMLSMMEDGMLLYRLERSMDRRMFKVNVGNMDDAEVESYLNDFMNSIKRAPIVDPKTGQIDLRKNFLDVGSDYVIPVRSQQDPSTIETLQAAQNQTSMEDIEFMENKVLAALRVPKTFLNFNEAQGKGQNLALMDIRFNRAINSIQQAVIMELTKIAIMHLYLLGFTDDLTNFTLTMNNPSNQLEMMELENQAKRIQNASQALQEQGGGIPLMSWHKVQKEIMGCTDSEISDMLQEIRLETAIANELQMTDQIIKKTNLFKQVDRIYGEPGAKYADNQGGGNEMGPMGKGGGPMSGGPMGGLDFGGDLGDMGEPGMDEGPDMGGAEGGADLEGMGGPEGGVLQEEQKAALEKRINEYMDFITNTDTVSKRRTPITEKSLLINEEINNTLTTLNEKVSKK